MYSFNVCGTYDNWGNTQVSWYNAIRVSRSLRDTAYKALHVRKDCLMRATGNLPYLKERRIWIYQRGTGNGDDIQDTPPCMIYIPGWNGIHMRAGSD